ncbi:MAG: hypothetical protein U9N11_04950 [Campylobacterota bacterium]|nr:hypothetical protein [Campylobacterota bacterium]
MRAIFMSLLLVNVLWATEVKLTKTQANFIAKKVWQNEGAGKDKYLVWWNKGEDFASVGIGHAIWFPKGHTERFREVFPMMLSYMESKAVKMPIWLNSNTDFPWQTKEAFFEAKQLRSKKYMELFTFLKRTMPYQASFMAERLNEALPQMLATIKSSKKATLIQRRFNNILYKSNGTIDEKGLYILLDYTNFKGEGTLKSERYNGQGWGLLQVLEHLDESNTNKYKAFSNSAKAMLSRRIKNSPPARGEERWRKGWGVRLDTYWK